MTIAIRNSYEQQLLSAVLGGHGGEVHLAVHSLEAHVLYILQHTKKRVVLVSTWRTEFVTHLSALFPLLELRSPEWIYDMVEEQQLFSLSALYRPLPLLDLRHIRANIISSRFAEYKRLAEAIGILVTNLRYEYIFADTQCEHDEKVHVISFQWVLDCIDEQRILPIMNYNLL